MDHIAELKEAAIAGKLVVVLGAGVSIALADQSTPARSWPDLLKSAFVFAKQSGHVDDRQYDRWLNTLNAGDMDELLGAAEFVSRKLGGRKGLLYGRWLEEEFSQQFTASNNKMNISLASLHQSRTPIATLNYDTLAEKSTKSKSITMNDPRSVLTWARRESADILHLHGLWTAPETIVLGISDYNEAVSDGFRQNLQRVLSSFSRILFIGCGETLYDPNLSSLLDWMRDTLGASGVQHYALVRDSEVEGKLRDPHWQGLVRPIGYGPDYTDLPSFIDTNFSSTSTAPTRPRRRAIVDAEVIQNYRKQVIVDCGKMTIEGVRADADTAKQKFDLEKLFVPLSVKQIPPEFPPNDPDREQKLADWFDKNGKPISFGQALAENDRMALLALPGGGKTILLKRVAVAYADPERQGAVADELPDTDFLPVLIRCREWRNYISLPIATMLSRMGEITGNLSLTGLYEALLERLRSGKIILLVDGLDEIHSDADRCTFVDNLESFIDTHKKIKVVVTSREAGFDLVAPSLMRFCTRWRISPLDGEAIELLCSHWHNLMGSSLGNPDDETKEVFESISGSSSLQRLAENPLLLTMLLVVKHGFGRLPPDRVTLYERAVEVLLDTWNIRGHAALNPREAVPQIAYVAYRLMEQGKQTATESELLALIEECRREVPLVRLYAKDSPSEFLKRVELRSSLILQAGKSPEQGRLVPFYQFRHLTFQEYMAAIAVVEGHYSGYSETDTALSPIIRRVVSDEWKEVVPMAAVLAKKRASSIINELLQISEKEEKNFLANGDKDPRYEWGSGIRLPPPVSRLLQCLIEEAEVTQDSLDRSARLITTFAHGCQTPENWTALMRGPFGSTILNEAWRLFVSNTLPRQSWMRNSVALLAAFRKPLEYWLSNDGLDSIRSGLTSLDSFDRGIAAATICGMIWQNNPITVTAVSNFQPQLEANILNDNSPTNVHSIWALGMLHSRKHETHAQINPLSPDVLSNILEVWMSGDTVASEIIPLTLASSTIMPRGFWTPTIDEKGKKFLKKFIRYRNSAPDGKSSFAQASAVIHYYVGWPLMSNTILNIYEGSIITEDHKLLLDYFKVPQTKIDLLVKNGESRIASSKKLRESRILRSSNKWRPKI